MRTRPLATSAASSTRPSFTRSWAAAVPDVCRHKTEPSMTSFQWVVSRDPSHRSSSRAQSSRPAAALSSTVGRGPSSVRVRTWMRAWTKSLISRGSAEMDRRQRFGQGEAEVTAPLGVRERRLAPATGAQPHHVVVGVAYIGVIPLRGAARRVRTAGVQAHDDGHAFRDLAEEVGDGRLQQCPGDQLTRGAGPGAGREDIVAVSDHDAVAGDVDEGGVPGEQESNRSMMACLIMSRDVS